MSHQNNHRGPGGRGGGKNPDGGGQQQPMTLQPGQVLFRLLCHINTAGGVIGSSGSIIKNLETQTGSRIRFEEAIQNCHERVVNVAGDSSVDKKITLTRTGNLGNDGKSDLAQGDGDADVVVEVSKAQEGLVRVFERVLDVELQNGHWNNNNNNGNNNGNDNNINNNNNNNNGNKNNNNNNNANNSGSGSGGVVVGCRLLAGTGQVGAVMGKGGKIVDGIRKSTGARIRVLKKEQIPACAGLDEELIQIMGSIVAVKKALVAVSRRLQDRAPGEKTAQMSSQGVSQNSLADIVAHSDSLSPPLIGNAADQSLGGHSLSADAVRSLGLNEESSRQKVVFRLLCSAGSAGGVIGKGANIVKFLEKETGASIKFASPVPGSKERVATITSLETPDPLYSPAQIAIVRVFTRSMEVAVDQGLILGLDKGESITARILVAKDEIDCLIDGGGRVASNISSASDVKIQVLGDECLPSCAAENDKVVQITGEYENVKSALFQITGKLRDNLFFNVVSEKGAGSRQYSYSALPEISHNATGNSVYSQLDSLSKNLSFIEQMDHLGFVQRLDSPRAPTTYSKLLTDSGNPVPLEHRVGSFGLEHERMYAQVLAGATAEVIIPAEVFASVYGENGINLARLKEISGATIIVRDPSPGDSNGKVIISGTPDRIQIAQSLLHAFILI